MNYIQKAGYKIWIADEFVKQIYKANKPGYNLIKKHFGSKYINKEGVDKKALGKLVFTNKDALKKLNKLMNPLIKKAIDRLPNNSLWFIELATYIFYPQDFANCFDKIVLIFTNKNWKKEKQNKKFSYLKKIPTIFVEKSKKQGGSILYIDSNYCKDPLINVDIFVNNCQSKKIFKNNILKVCASLK